MNIAEIYESHYLPEKSKKRRPSTVAGYDSSVRLHVLPRWGSCEIEDIDPDDLQEWVDGFDRAGAAEKAYKCLRQIVRWWIRAKRLHIPDPTLYVELPAKEPYRPDVLDAEGVTAMLRGMWGHAMEAVAICSVTMGLRRGEACALTWGDINLKTGEVRVSKSRQCVGGEVVTEGTKNRQVNEVMLPSQVRHQPLAPDQGQGPHHRRRVARQGCALDQVVVQTHAPAARQHDQSAPYLGDARYRGRHRHRDGRHDARAHRHIDGVRPLHSPAPRYLRRRSGRRGDSAGQERGQAKEDAAGRIVFRIPYTIRQADGHVER